MNPREAGSNPHDEGVRAGARAPVRVLFANNYDMARARAGWRAGLYPAHHLFGTAELGPPFEVVDLPYGADDLCGHITRLTRGRLGDVGQQVAAVRRRGRGSADGRPGSIVYGAAAHELRSLAALRAAGLFPAPIVGVFHGVPSLGPFSRPALRGFDRAIAMSQYTRQLLLAAGMPPERITVLGWGADLAFAGFAPIAAAASDAPVVATGKTGRDMPTLVEALGATGVPGRIYCERTTLEGRVRIPPNVQLLAPSPASSLRSGPLSYAHTLADLRSAALIAIPLSEMQPLHGLTEVVDALACGRPMILTRAPYFDFDIEAIGCGWWVEPGDVSGWSERLSTAMADRERLDEMGRAGRAWAGEHFNAGLFGEGVREVLLDVARDGLIAGGLSQARRRP
jgi:glycosyltransferase involved in cell wall biosynthesis